MLRIIYSLSTPFFIRSHDALGGHISYIDMVSDHLKLPTTIDQSWEYYQPPLYYVFSAFLAWLPKYFGVCRNSLLATWQAESCILSIATLACCFCISHLLFDRKRYAQRLWFFACIAVFPVLIFNASCINNDVLFGFISVIWLGLLIAFWKRTSLRKMATDRNSLGVQNDYQGPVLLRWYSYPIYFCLLPNQISWKSKLALAAMRFAIISLLAGWFYIPRALVSKSSTTFMVGNIDAVGKYLCIDQGLDKIITFNPLAIIQHPFC